MMKYCILLLASAYFVQSSSQSCACTRELNPVCGSDGVTYGNPCMFRCARRGRNLTGTPGRCRVRREAPEPECTCPDNMQVVCGSDGNIYLNKCYLECERARVPFIEVLHEGPCKMRAPCACSGKYNPFCGSDGHTYGNECAFNCARSGNRELTVRYKGECHVSKRSADCICTFIYSPVCGDDGNTYSNQCMMNCKAKESGRVIGVNYVGPCQERKG